MSPAKPKFELGRVSDDGATEAPEIVALTEMPWTKRSDRRRFLGISLTTAAALAAARSGAARSATQTGKAAHGCLWAYGEPVLSLAANPIKDVLVSGGDGTAGAVKLWGLPQGNLIKKLKKGKSPTLALAIAPNGKLLVTGEGNSSGNRGALKLWSLPSRKLVKRLGGNQGRVSGLTISHDGTLLASVSSIDRTVKTWSLPEGNLVNTLSSGLAFAVALSSGGELLATGAPGGTIQLWSPPDGLLLKEVDAHAGGVLALAMSGDGTTLVSGGKNGEIKLWSVPSLDLIKARTGHSKAVRALAISPSGKLFASASFDRTVKLWRLPSGSLIRTMTGHTAKVSSVVFCRGGTILASASYDKTIRLWDIKTGRMKRCLADLKANPRSRKGVTIKGKNAYGQTVTWTQPCGSPIPPGAVCTCNCIPGGVRPACSCVGHHTCSCVGHTACTCDAVCTCQSVCSCVSVSHYWHPN